MINYLDDDGNPVLDDILKALESMKIDLLCTNEVDAIDTTCIAKHHYFTGYHELASAISQLRLARVYLAKELAGTL